MSTAMQSAQDFGPDRLGGRLTLLAPEDLDGPQTQVYRALEQRVVPEAAHDGFTVRLSDGRFIGPFNALLRVPDLAAGLGRFTAEVTAAGLAEDVRQAVILTVGAAWPAPYEIEAHRCAARTAGLPEAAIEAIIRGEVPDGLGGRAAIAQRLAAALMKQREVPDELYREAVDLLGEPGIITVLCLIGQYQLISSILVCFQVPVPDLETAS
ncbi:carboxymuconolactone decarboxylase family protein [Streptomyces sp. MUM 16J]|uniref:carboxymuconolactone decarboxylase family protein n=1 Tax=Streptomyces sp. MUM 16J TaxID=2791988 RepID=UPI001F037C6B|nr:carboxymuconolactone decarboxylase family protein [Streptomyces sp. MUM 16J]MCH0558440.1 carboxymuconolactone decarboxylase family protein [Streptomyces sp. MUM 16J]